MIRKIVSSICKENRVVKIWPENNDENRLVDWPRLANLDQLGNITSRVCQVCVNNHELISIKEALKANLVQNQSDLTNGHLLGPSRRSESSRRATKKLQI